MSSSLYWRPAPKEEPPEESLPDGLKFVLRERAKRGWDNLRDKVDYGKPDVPYLEGLVDAGNEEVSEGASALLKAIETHGEVEVWEQG